MVGAIASFSRFANATCAILVTSNLQVCSENKTASPFEGWRLKR
jgi:hypothetical protein